MGGRRMVMCSTHGTFAGEGCPHCVDVDGNSIASLKAQLADLRERHEAFVRKVCSEAQRAADLATCTSLTSYLANEILALCGAELCKERK